MVDLVRKHAIEVFDHGIRFAPDIGYTVTAFATSLEIQKLQQSEYHVVQHEDADNLGKLRQRQVGVGNRYARSTSRRSARLSKRRKRYLNVDEVEIRNRRSCDRGVFGYREADCSAKSNLGRPPVPRAEDWQSKRP